MSTQTALSREMLTFRLTFSLEERAAILMRASELALWAPADLPAPWLVEARRLSKSMLDAALKIIQDQGFDPEEISDLSDQIAQPDDPAIVRNYADLVLEGNL